MNQTKEKKKGNIVQSVITTYPDWRNGLEKRHLKFVEAFIDSNYEIHPVASKFFYSLHDMQSIFTRIERSLEKFQNAKTEEANNLSSKKPIVLEPVQLPDEFRFDKIYSSLKSDTKIIFEKVLVSSEHINLYETYPKRLAEILETLLETKDLDQTADRLSMDKRHLVARITGRKKPRKPCEQGALYYLSSPKSVSA